MKKTLIILFTILAHQGIACINEYRTLLSGQVIYTDAISGLPYYKKLNSSELLRELSELDSLYKIDNSVKALSDYGAILIYLGRLDEAIDLYRKIEQQQPSLYATAANTGTAFELLGHIDSASFYIQKAININPNSHHGSEWIHLKILKAKKDILTNREYLRNTSILGLDFGREGKPTDPKNLNLTVLEAQIRFQLSERMTFVKAPDLIVGQLLFDLGNICALTTDVQAALECYKLSKEYGYSSDLLDERISTLEPLAHKATLASSTEKIAIRNPILSLIIIAVAGLGFVWVGMKVIKRIRKKSAGANTGYRS